MNPQDQAPVVVPETNNPTSVNNSDTLEGPIKLLKSSCSFVKMHWKILASIAVIPSLFNYFANYLTRTGSPGLIILGMLMGIISGILMVAMLGAMINSVKSLTNDSTIKLSFKEQYMYGFKRFWSIVLVLIMSSLTFIGSFALLIIPGIIVSTYVAFYIYALIIDDKKGFSALLDSYSLVRGRWLEVFGRMFVIGFFVAILQIISTIVIFLVSLILGVNIVTVASTNTELPFSVMLVGFVVSLFLQSIVVPLTFTYSYKLYTELKRTRPNEVSTVAFKRWLVTFMVIAPIAVILFFGLIITLVALGSAQKISQNTTLQAQIQSQLIEMVNQSSTTPTVTK